MGIAICRCGHWSPSGGSCGKSRGRDASLVRAAAYLIAPIIAAIITYIVSRIGLNGRIRQVEYLIKRVDLVEKLKSATSKSDHSDGNRKIVDELSEIASFLRATSIMRTKDSFAKFKNRSILAQIFILPYPQSANGWIFTFSYYYIVFGAISIIYFSLAFRDVILQFFEMLHGEGFARVDTFVPWLVFLVAARFLPIVLEVSRSKMLWRTANSDNP